MYQLRRAGRAGTYSCCYAVRPGARALAGQYVIPTKRNNRDALE